MAVQKSKKSPSKRNMRRSDDALSTPPMSVDKLTGEISLRHHVSKTGYYKGKLVIRNK